MFDTGVHFAVFIKANIEYIKYKKPNQFKTARKITVKVCIVLKVIFYQGTF